MARNGKPFMGIIMPKATQKKEAKRELKSICDFDEMTLKPITIYEDKPPTKELHGSIAIAFTNHLTFLATDRDHVYIWKEPFIGDYMDFATKISVFTKNQQIFPFMNNEPTKLIFYETEWIPSFPARMCNNYDDFLPLMEEQKTWKQTIAIRIVKALYI